jgi:hypothetical protein
LGNGNGTFQSAVNYAAGAYPNAVAVADMNGDGRPDLAVANFLSNQLFLLLGNRNAATHFQVSAPASATAGTPFTITVSALTAGGQLDAVYTGTAHFTSSDGAAVLPADYTFSKRDLGVHTFTVTLNTTGNQSITATAAHNRSITGQAVVTVNAAAPAPAAPRGSGQGDSAGVDATVSATLLRFPATLPTEYPFVNSDAAARLVTSILTAAGSPTITANETFRQTKSLAAGTPHAAGWTAHVGQPFDPEGDLLNPADIEAYFAQTGFVAPSSAQPPGAWR